MSYQLKLLYHVIPISSYPDVMKPIAPYCTPVACRCTKLVKVLNTNGDEQRAWSQWISQLPVDLVAVEWW